MEMISSFAKTGIPSANPTDPDSVWKPFNISEYNALFLDLCPTQELIPRAAEKDILWNTLIPDLMEALSDDDEEPKPTPTKMSCMVGSFIGLELTEEEAGRIIGALIITLAVIAALVLLGIVMKVCLSRKSSANKPV